MFQNKKIFSFKIKGGGVAEKKKKKKNDSLDCAVTQYFILFWNDRSKSFFLLSLLQAKFCVHIHV